MTTSGSIFWTLLTVPITSVEPMAWALTDADALPDSSTLLENAPIVLTTRAAEASPRTPIVRFMNPPLR